MATGLIRTKPGSQRFNRFPKGDIYNWISGKGSSDTFCQSLDEISTKFSSSAAFLLEDIKLYWRLRQRKRRRKNSHSNWGPFPTALNTHKCVCYILTWILSNCVISWVWKVGKGRGLKLIGRNFNSNLLGWEKNNW